MLTPSAPISRIVCQLVDVRAGQNEMYGGSSDTDVTDWQVNPYGRTPSLAVITAIPVQNRPRTSRIDVGEGAQLVIPQAFVTARRAGNRVSRPAVTDLDAVTCVVSLKTWSRTISKASRIWRPPAG